MKLICVRLDQSNDAARIPELGQDKERWRTLRFGNFKAVIGEQVAGSLGPCRNRFQCADFQSNTVTASKSFHLPAASTFGVVRPTYCSTRCGGSFSTVK